MAALELRNKTYRVVFMYGSRKYSYSLDTGDRQTEALSGRPDKEIMRALAQRLLDLAA